MKFHASWTDTCCGLPSKTDTFEVIHEAHGTENTFPLSRCSSRRRGGPRARATTPAETLTLRRQSRVIVELLQIRPAQYEAYGAELLSFNKPELDCPCHNPDSKASKPRERAPVAIKLADMRLPRPGVLPRFQILRVLVPLASCTALRQHLS